MEFDWKYSRIDTKLFHCFMTSKRCTIAKDFLFSVMQVLLYIQMRGDDNGFNLNAQC